MNDALAVRNCTICGDTISVFSHRARDGRGYVCNRCLSPSIIVRADALFREKQSPRVLVVYVQRTLGDSLSLFGIMAGLKAMHPDMTFIAFIHGPGRHPFWTEELDLIPYIKTVHRPKDMPSIGEVAQFYRDEKCDLVMLTVWASQGYYDEKLKGFPTFRSTRAIDVAALIRQGFFPTMKLGKMPETARSHFAERAGPLVALHVRRHGRHRGGSGAHKEPTREQILTLTRSLPHVKFLMLGHGDRFEGEIPPNVADLTTHEKAWPLQDTLRVIHDCDLFVGGDSGLVHVAALQRKTPIIVFNVDDLNWRPWAPKDQVHLLMGGKNSSGDAVFGLTRNVLQRIEASRVKQGAIGGNNAGVGRTGKRMAIQTPRA